ncbi:MAG: N-acetyltransferase family protein [Candidatus Binatia bacterium]
MRIRTAQEGDTVVLLRLVASAIGERRAAALVRAPAACAELLIAEELREPIGCLAYRTDWFQCTFVSAVAVAESARRRGVARALFAALESRSPSARLFSSTEETNGVAIRMHRALGFTPSGHIDNLPQGYRELLFYKRLPR